MFRFIAIFLTAGLMLSGCQTLPDEAHPSAVQFKFSDWPGPTLDVYGVEPESADPDAPIILVMHGVRRNADEYRDNWIDLAESYGLRVYAPAFDAERFPGAVNYNLGGLGPDVPSAFDAIEPLYQFIRETRGGDQSGYFIFGHSAGAQFVHRFLCFGDTTNLKLAIAANAGWYTMPDYSYEWPYGLTNSPEQPCSLSEWFEKPLLLMLGDQDTDPQDQNLRRTPEAMAQGTHRLARGINFLETAREQAEESALPINWRFEIVEGVAHDNRGMAEAAAPILKARNMKTSDPAEGPE